MGQFLEKSTNLSNDLVKLLEQESRYWLVTGGAGFIGSHLVENLLRHKQRVRVFDDFSTGSRGNLKVSAAGFESKFDLIEGDIRDADACRRAVMGVDIVLHQAALGSVPRSLKDPLTTNAVNVDGFIKVLEATHKAGLKHIVYASSSSVYGDSDKSPKFEHECGAPLSPYAASKACDEVYAKTFFLGFGLSSIGLRYFNVFGPRQDPAGPYAAVVPKWLAELRAGRPTTINGDGLITRDFCYITNVIEANIRAALLGPKRQGAHVCNIACAKSMNLKTLAQILRVECQQILGQELPEPIYAPFRVGDIVQSLASVAQAKELIGYEPRVLAEDGLKLTVRAAFEQPERRL